MNYINRWNISYGMFWEQPSFIGIRLVSLRLSPLAYFCLFSSKNLWKSSHSGRKREMNPSSLLLRRTSSSQGVLPLEPPPRCRGEGRWGARRTAQPLEGRRGKAEAEIPGTPLSLAHCRRRSKKFVWRKAGPPWAWWGIVNTILRHAWRQTN